MTGAAAVAAALERHGWYVDVGAGHNWERRLSETGVPPEQIAEVLNASDFDIGDIRTPVLAVQKAADRARAAVVAEKAKEPKYDWRGGTVTRKPRGHVCGRDATCAEWYAFKVKTLDGKPVLLCCWHYRTEAPRQAINAWEKVMEPERAATAIWADEMAALYSRMPKMPEAEAATDERVEVAA